MKSLSIWLLKDGEQLPLVEGAKKMRMWRLGEELSRRGHNVTWFSSNFNHMKKDVVTKGDTLHKISKNFHIKLLSCGSYKKNFSLARILHHRRFGKRLRKELSGRPTPDIIVAAHPSIESSSESTRYGQMYDVPVIVDVRDMWPDTFKDYFIPFLGPIIRLCSFPLRLKAYKAFSGATALVSMSPYVLNWAQKLCKLKNKPSKIFYIASPPFTKKSIQSQAIKDIQSIALNKKAKIYTFIGTFGKSYDLETIVEVAKNIQEKHKNILFVLAGNGEKFEHIKKISKGLDNLYLTDWLTESECSDLLFISDVGIIPVTNVAIPNKFGEFLAAGIPLLSCGRGQLSGVINTRDLGFTYLDGDAKSAEKAVLKMRKYNMKNLRKNALNLFNESFNSKIIYNEFSLYVEYIESLYKENL